jgi:hypothetical protein
VRRQRAVVRLLDSRRFFGVVIEADVRLVADFRSARLQEEPDKTIALLTDRQWRFLHDGRDVELLAQDRLVRRVRDRNVDERCCGAFDVINEVRMCADNRHLFDRSTQSEVSKQQRSNSDCRRRRQPALA